MPVRRVIPNPKEYMHTAPASNTSSTTSQNVSQQASQGYFNALGDCKILSAEDELELVRRFQEHDDQNAAKKLVRAHLRLVVKIAHKYRRLVDSVDDLIQEGNLGVIKAVQRFDPTKGTRLVTYARWWIRAYILKYIMDNHHIVKLGTTQAQRKLYYNLEKTRTEMRAQGIQATPKRIAQRLNVSVSDVVDMSQRLNKSNDVRLDAPLRNDSTGTYADLMPAATTSPEATFASERTRRRVRNALETFAETLQGRDLKIWRERTVNPDPTTLRALGEDLSISRERVRQLEARILRKCRAFLTKQNLHKAIN